MLRPVIAALTVVLLVATAAQAIDKCKIKVDKKTGVIQVFAKGLGGPVLWGTASGDETESFFNDATCVASGKAKKCEIADPATLAAKTPPPGCTLYLDDGVAACSSWIPGCTPGSRGHHTLVEFNTVGSPTCAWSGVLFESGPDLDDDGVLAPGEVTASQAVCDPHPASCALILAAAPSSTDGVYTIAPGGGETEAYCDMTNGGWTYLELGMGQWDQSYANFTLLTTADLQTTQVQEFFIWAYNKQGGANALATWTAGNCCYRPDGANVLLFGGQYLCPDSGSGSNLWDYTAGSSYQFIRNSGPPQYPTLPSDFFATYPVTEGPACTVSGNPAYFARRLAP